MGIGLKSPTRGRTSRKTEGFYACLFATWVFIESSLQKIISEGTDWRFINELMRELKA
jgi:hypothetical protein